MKEGKVDTCAVLDADKQRLARGRYELSEDGQTATFLPTGTVTAGQMLAVAFLWLDGEDMLPVAEVHPPGAGELRFHLRLVK